MSNHHDSFPTGDQLLKNLEDCFCRHAIQVASRLIRDDQCRIINHRPGDGNPLFLTA